MSRASVVCESIVCANCLYCDRIKKGNHAQFFCCLDHSRVKPNTPFCEDYEWSGVYHSNEPTLKLIDDGMQYLVA